MLVAPGKVELNNTAKCQTRRFTFGIVESVKYLHQDHADEEKNKMLSLFHVPLRKGRVQSQVCMSMVDDLYNFTYKILGKIHFFLPAVSRAVLPNTCSMLYYHSLFKGSMPKHQDLNLIPKEANGHQKILRGSPIITLSIFAQMRYDICGLDKEDMNPYEYTAGKNYTNNIKSRLLDSGSILIWHPRVDERYMHSLEFPPEVTKQKTKKCVDCLTYGDGPMVMAPITCQGKMTETWFLMMFYYIHGEMRISQWSLVMMIST
jgi:hypothetical protein